MNKPALFLVFIFCMICLSACMSTETSNALTAYRLWSYENPPKDLKLLEGKYWQSGHFTKEYILYLHLRASLKWTKQLIAQNNLKPVDAKEVAIPDDAPSWFTPDSDYAVFARNGDAEESAYYINTASGKMYIYEEQL
jgi:hypothetical protein